jgi:hypothetical protein
MNRWFAIYFKDPHKNAQVKSDVDGEGGLDHRFETFDDSNVADADLVNI